MSGQVTASDTYILGLAKEKVVKTLKDSYFYNVVIGKSVDDYDWDLNNVDTFSLFTNIYKKYDPSKLKNIAYLVEQNRGQEKLLLRKICKEYGANEHDIQAFALSSEKIHHHRNSLPSQSATSAPLSSLMGISSYERTSHVPRVIASGGGTKRGELEQQEFENRVESSYLNLLAERQLEDKIHNFRQNTGMCSVPYYIHKQLLMLSSFKVN